MINDIRKFWEDNLDWDKIETNLKKYTNLNRVFTIDFLRKYNDKGPFYTHPLTLWLNYQGPVTKQATERLEKLFDILKNSDGFSNKVKMLQQFQDTNKFWDTLSELEIASALLKLGFTVKLLEKNNMPDIEATRNGDLIYIEVYNFKKFFYRLFQLERILAEINNTNQLLKQNRLTVEFQRIVGKTTDIKDSKIEELFGIVVEFLKNEEKVLEAIEEYPHIIYKEDDNMQIAIFNADTANYNPEKSLDSVNFDGYLEQMFKEITSNKSNFKQLEKVSGIKIGAINILFNSDFQTALAGWDRLKNFVLPDSIDCLIIYANSIHEEFEFGNVRYKKFKDVSIEQRIKNLLQL